MQTKKVLHFLYSEMQSNPFQKDLISIIDRSIFCMILPHSLWFERFCRILKAMGSDFEWNKWGFVQPYSIC